MGCEMLNYACLEDSIMVALKALLRLTSFLYRMDEKLNHMEMLSDSCTGEDTQLMDVGREHLQTVYDEMMACAGRVDAQICRLFSLLFEREENAVKFFGGRERYDTAVRLWRDGEFLERMREMAGAYSGEPDKDEVDWLVAGILGIS